MKRVQMTDAQILMLRAASLTEQSEACDEHGRPQTAKALRGGAAALVQLVIDTKPDHVVRGGA